MQRIIVIQYDCSVNICLEWCAEQEIIVIQYNCSVNICLEWCAESNRTLLISYTDFSIGAISKFQFLPLNLLINVIIEPFIRFLSNRVRFLTVICSLLYGIYPCGNFITGWIQSVPVEQTINISQTGKSKQDNGCVYSAHKPIRKSYI